jgi:phage tail sheath protein FI
MGVATSVTAFMGRALKGPTDSAVLVNSFVDFERRFGGLHRDYPMSQAVRDFYLNGGSQALIVRLFKSKDQNSDRCAKTKQPLEGLTLKAAFPGTWGNHLKVTKTKLDNLNPNDFESLKVRYGLNDDSLNKEDFFNLTVEDQATGTIEQINHVSTADQTKTGPRHIENALLVESQLVRFASYETPSPSPADGPISFKILPNEDKAQATIAGVILQAITSGEEGTRLTVSRNTLNTSLPSDLPAESTLTVADFFNLVITNTDNQDTTNIANVQIREPNSPRYISTVLAAANAETEYWVSFVGIAPEQTTSKAFSGGQDSESLENDDYTQNGQSALGKADIFNLLCIPDDKPNQDIDPKVYQAAMAFCYKHRAMLIVDPPQGWNQNNLPSNVTTKLGALGLFGDAARNAVLYYPRVKRPGETQAVGPCGMIAGIMARTDVKRGVWKAPAGIDDAAIYGVQALQEKLNDDDNGILNPQGINCLRTFPGYGTVVWGARTLRGADQLGDEYKYVPVRRLTLFIEESLYRGTKWVVFEPNDEPLWAQIRLNVGAFMHDLFRQGAFQGTTPRQAYFVKCDKDTTTQSDINRGIVNIEVGFAPLKPAEFVVIKIQQMAGELAT